MGSCIIRMGSINWCLLSFFTKKVCLRYAFYHGPFINIFLLFILITSNPFDRIFPVPENGRDLNPLLQDPGLIIHPPLLYLGYVGTSVPFAFAVAVLINKSIKKILSQKKINMIKDLNLNSRPTDLNPELYYLITSLFEKE